DSGSSARKGLEVRLLSWASERRKAKLEIRTKRPDMRGVFDLMSDEWGVIDRSLFARFQLFRPLDFSDSHLNIVHFNGGGRLRESALGDAPQLVRRKAPCIPDN